MTVVDGTIATVALPTIARDVGASPAASIWVVNAYQLALGDGGAAAFFAGRSYRLPEDLSGGIRGLHHRFTLLRVIQFADLFSVRPFHPGPGRRRHRERQHGVDSHDLSRQDTGPGAGPQCHGGRGLSRYRTGLAAAILSLASWPWLFAVNVPLGILGLAISLRTLPRTPGSGRAYDLKSAILSVLTFGLLISGADALGHRHSARTVAVEITAAILIGIAFVRRQLSRPAPLLPVDLLRRSNFALSIATAVCTFIAQMLAYVSLPFYLQHVLGRTPVESGLLITPWPMATFIAAPFAGYLADRHSAGILGGLGLGTFSVGLLSLALMPAHPASSAIVWRMALCGLGFGFFQAPNNREILSSAPKERSGGASGMLSLARLMGQTLGATLVALIFNMFSDGNSTVALIVGACFAAGAAIVSCMRISRSRASETALGVAYVIDPIDGGS